MLFAVPLCSGLYSGLFLPVYYIVLIEAIKGVSASGIQTTPNRKGMLHLLHWAEQGD